MEQDSQFVIAKIQSLDETITVSPETVESAWAKAIAPQPPGAFVRWRWPMAAAATVVGVALLSPTGRVWAEEVWTRLVLRRTVSINIELAGAMPSLLLPNVFPLTPSDSVARQRTNSALSASALADFPVRALASSALPYEPSFVIEQHPVQERVFDLAEAKADLRKTGRVEPTWPAGIDRARIILEPQGKTVVSYYGKCPQLVGPWKSCAMLVQSRSMVLRLPSHLSPVEYTRFSLELAGIPAKEATALAELSGASPTLFLPLETKAEVRKVRARGVDAMLIIYPTDPGGETAYVLDWHEDGFLFQIFGRDPSRAVALAETLRTP